MLFKGLSGLVTTSNGTMPESAQIGGGRVGASQAGFGLRCERPRFAGAQGVQGATQRVDLTRRLGVVAAQHR